MTLETTQALLICALFFVLALSFHAINQHFYIKALRQNVQAWRDIADMEKNFRRKNQAEIKSIIANIERVKNDT